MFTTLHAIILGIVEGITEFLPVSSTGHLILAKKALHLSGEQLKPAIDAFLVVVQFGSLLAAIIYYRRQLMNLTKGIVRFNKEAWKLFLLLIIATLPLLGLGYLLKDIIPAHFDSALIVAIALIVGGVLMITVDKTIKNGNNDRPFEKMSLWQALTIGLFQMLALWPGMSRSMSAIIGGRVAQLSRKNATDFSFLLAVPTLGAVTIFTFIKKHHVIMQGLGTSRLLIGLLVSFIVGWIVIAAFLRYLKRFGFLPFAYYRIFLGLILLLIFR